MRLRALLVRNTHELLDYLCGQVLSLGTLFLGCVQDVKLEPPDYQFLYSKADQNYLIFVGQDFQFEQVLVRLGLKQVKIF